MQPVIKTIVLLASLWAAGAFAATADKPPKLPPLSAGDLNITFPGQYRVNFYSVDNDRAGEEQQNAARFRMRQSIDIKFDERLKTSLRMQLNHTNDNITNAGDASGNDIQVRHAYIDYLLLDNTEIKAGLVPVQEYQNDVLYSKSWGYNPFALEGFSRFGTATLHYFAAALVEGDETNSSDDTIHYQADYIYGFSPQAQLIASASYLDAANLNGSGSAYVVAAKGAVKINEQLSFNSSVMASKTDGALLGTTGDAKGFAFLFELNAGHAYGSAALLATHASGREDGSGFLVPMNFSKTNSYWGYTGIITVMPQTDTGFASDSVLISNNGYGMSSLQVKSDFRLSKETTLYIGAGWFGNTRAKGRESRVGIDSVLMGTYAFNRYLKLDMGVAYAQLHDSLSGYSQPLRADNFNQPQGVTRSKRALFGRLQIEF